RCDERISRVLRPDRFLQPVLLLRERRPLQRPWHGQLAELGRSLPAVQHPVQHQQARWTHWT
ncbi:unnamed protein product, partial [Closterium sp. NIES-54]